MLYVKFKIEEVQKYVDFQKLFNHMVDTRRPDYKPEEEEGPEIDWDNLNEQEMEEALEAINNFDPQKNRYHRFLPNYADAFLRRYLDFDEDNFGVFGFKEVLLIFNYLEFGFEVDMDALKKISNQQGIVKFSTDNFPFGGIDRFLICLKAFDLIPEECYNGFSILEIHWTSDFKYEPIELPEKTKRYLDAER